jgi:hypothetical protein
VSKPSKQLFDLATNIAKYCELYLSPNKEINSTDHDITLEIIQLERDIIKKKLSI